MKFLALAASHRPESYNRKLVTVAASELRSRGHEVDVALYGEFDMPVYNDAIEMPDMCHSFAQRAESAQGIIISTPEYNWSYPGSLKNILDWTSCITPNPLAGKTAFLMAASPGARGGILALDHLKSPLESCEVFVYPRVFPLGHCMDAFAEIMLANPTQHKQLLTMLDGYLHFTHKLLQT